MSPVEVLKKRKMSSSNSPCAACKCLRRKCTQECVFAPYFPPDNPQKFTNVHKVFGASNVAKLLNELNAAQREDAVNSLAYEAEYRLRDPVYGCVGLISILQHKLKQVQHDLEAAKKELAAYIGPTTGGLPPMMNQSGFIPQHSSFGPSSAFQMMPYSNMQPMMGLPMGVPHGAQLVIREPQPQQQFLEAQQLAAAAAREQEMLRSYEQQQNDLGRFSFDDGGGPVTATGFNQMPAGAGAATMQPSLALGSSYENVAYHHIQQHANVAEHSHQLQLQPQAELLLQQQQSVTAHHQQSQLVQPSQHQPQRAKSEEGRSVGPTC
ncbi:LOB domain-containing protein 36 [Phtheirospermum japonicum]|uniref:LOB domain-containing protein 36 n=1 Tax=Phtheirospermum japonicum TaxID=374723 RepID=A0A830C4I5_9LAMI|nr:LOB domain-containing protein 36 [Phtheirospermum japonicum]